MNEKMLGKIAYAEFGWGGYQDVQMGLSLTFAGESWTVGDFIGFWGEPPGTGATWTEDDQTKHFGNTVRTLSNFLQDAKVRNVSQLKGKPVEVVFEGGRLKSWRILKEVL